MGGGGHSHGGTPEIHIPKGKTRIAQCMGFVAWFWVFYRFKKDGKAVLGLEKPWDAHH